MPDATQLTKVDLPVLKAWQRIFDLLECVHDYPYDREGFQQAVLRLYGNEKSSKSVFRGMAIPTLRNLGLILGYGSDIRASANGSLLYIARKASEDEGMRALRAILVELDENIGVLPYLSKKSTLVFDEFLEYWLGKVSTAAIRKSTNPKAQERAAHERLLDWIKFLTFAEVLYKEHENIRIDEMHFEQSKKDLDITVPEKKDTFSSLLIASYKKIVNREQEGVGTVEIEDLRRELAITTFQNNKLILTENQFDKLLSEQPKTTTDYVITLGRSMGADEKLYYYQGKYYQTIFVRFLAK